MVSGIKVTNILSNKLFVETVDANAGLNYQQVFSGNMSKVDPPKITKFSGSPHQGGV